MSEETPEEARDRRYGGRRTPMPDWNLNHLAAILGTTGVSLGRYLMGERYPNVEMMKRFEVLFGWKASEQIDLIPYPFDYEDMRYAMVMRQVINEWKLANPRTEPAGSLKSRFPSKYEDPWGHKARRGEQE
jgi:hypothetical protein